ncbi:hypothetical protein VNI00_000579 [Paramarasmius palmivorus]|uniref:Uncharacterized protein n=1 Tax=Paramarasmius palmivorus TaxID=297713 RepID=A0AAW0E5Q3_9AGAR
MSFTDAHDVTIQGNATNVVYRDQHNNSTVNICVTGHKRPAVKRQRRKELSNLEQYREIILGDIYKIKRIHAGDICEEEWDENRQSIRVLTSHRSIHHVKLYRDGDVFTLVTYSGQDASKIWTDSFLKHTDYNNTTMLFQLFGVNRSEVPGLIFYDDWLPMSHFYSKETFWMTLYVGMLGRRMGCLEWEVWLNTKSGQFSRGPTGPSFDAKWRLGITKDVPSTVDMLKPDTFVQYLSKIDVRGLDGYILDYAKDTPRSTCTGTLLDVDHQCSKAACTGNHGVWKKGGDGLWRNVRGPPGYGQAPELLHDLSFGVVHSAMRRRPLTKRQEDLYSSWKVFGSAAFFNGTNVGGGFRRFSFDFAKFNPSDRVTFHGTFWPRDLVDKAWLSQAHRIFDEDSSEEIHSCFLASFYAKLSLKADQEAVSDPSPSSLDSSSFNSTLAHPAVYLFIQPPPTRFSEVDNWTNRSISFWTFDANGATQISEHERKRLRLPNVVLMHAEVSFFSWPKYVYDALHTWQVARGFDPATSDFARSLAVSILDPEPKETQLGERGEGDTASSLSWWQATTDISAFAI